MSLKALMPNAARKGMIAPTFHVKAMSTEDLQFAVSITEKVDWGMSQGDFEFMMELEPKGCFVLFDGQERVGLATSVSFGNIAWFGNLIVTESCRNRGGGSILVNHATEYLRGVGVETVGLYAYMNKIPFYERLGFFYDSDFLVLTGTACLSKAEGDMKWAETQEMPKIIEFDKDCLGVSRAKILRPILSDPDNLCCIACEQGCLSGYAVAKVYRGRAELGPLICSKERSDVAIDLLKFTMDRLRGFDISVFVPTKEVKIVDVLQKAGFEESFSVARMFLGPPATSDCICLAESLERG